MVGNFYTFSKRHNSTLTPTGSGEAVSFSLKDATSVLSPILEINSLPAPPAWNYVYITAFHRYYFVDSGWSYYRGIWSAQLSCDVLASWKAAILSTSALVVHSSNNYNLYAIDNRIANTTDYIRTLNWEDMQGVLSNQHDSADGYFVLDVINNQTLRKSGVTKKYYMNRDQMNAFAGAIQNQGIWEQLKQWFTNPLDSIVDCYYVPINITSYNTSTSSYPVVLGEYQVPGVQAFETLNTSLNSKSYTTNMNILWTYDDFRRATATEINIFMPFCGVSALPTDKMTHTQMIHIDYSVDPNSGDIQAIAYNDDSSQSGGSITFDERTVLAEWSGNCKIQLPIGQVQTRVGTFLAALPGTSMGIANIITGNQVVGAGMILQSIASLAVQQNMIKMGSFAGSILGASLGDDKAWQRIRMIQTAYKTTCSPSSIRNTLGNVYDNVISLGSCTGYCQTSGASVSINGTDKERTQINALLDSGIYIE